MVDEWRYIVTSGGAMSQMFVSFLVGISAGVLSGLFGVGGGIIVVPFLILFWGFNQHLASATSLVIFLLPIGAMGVWKYYQAGVLQPEHLKIGLLIGFGAMCGSYFGAQLSEYMNSTYLQRGFAVILIFVAYQLWVKA